MLALGERGHWPLWLTQHVSSGFERSSPKMTGKLAQDISHMARRKITDKGGSLAEIAAASDLPELTASQRLFVEGLLSGKTASDAYRSAYDCSSSAPNSIWCEASKLRNNPHVAQWLFAARLASLDTGRITLEGHTAELARLREIAIDSGNVGAAVQAEHMRGKASGLYVERYEIDHFHHAPGH